MKINGYQAIQKYQSNQPFNKKEQVNEEGKPKKSDQVEISPQAKQMQGAHRIEAERSEKVENLKQQIEGGNYHVSPEDVAKKMYHFWNK